MSTCTACGGSGEVLSRGRLITCPTCHGSGQK